MQWLRLNPRCLTRKNNGRYTDGHLISGHIFHAGRLWSKAADHLMAVDQYRRRVLPKYSCEYEYCPIPPPVSAIPDTQYWYRPNGTQYQLVPSQLVPMSGPSALLRVRVSVSVSVLWLLLLNKFPIGSAVLEGLRSFGRQTIWVTDV